MVSTMYLQYGQQLTWIVVALRVADCLERLLGLTSSKGTPLRLNQRNDTDSYQTAKTIS